MALLSGLLYSVPYKNIKDFPHSKHYYAQAKNKEDYSMFGYEVIKLDADIVFYVGWREDSMKEYRGEVGDYLVQTPLQPPRIVKSWNELRSDFKVFRKKIKK